MSTSINEHFCDPVGLNDDFLMIVLTVFH